MSNIMTPQEFKRLYPGTTNREIAKICHLGYSTVTRRFQKEGSKSKLQWNWEDMRALMEEHLRRQALIKEANESRNFRTSIFGDPDIDTYWEMGGFERTR